MLKGVLNMYNREFTDNHGRKYIRIDKRKARRLFDQGLTITICPDNLRPFGFFGSGVEISKNTIEKTFDCICNEYKFYNCVSCETGYNIAFYQGVQI